MAEPRVLVVGGGSFLARHFVEVMGAEACRVVGHRAVAGDGGEAASLFDGVDAVVNFAFHPALRTAEYRADLDIDRRVAAAAPRGCHVVAIGSRTVYAPEAAWGADEGAAVAPATTYGRAKLAAEAALRERVAPDDLTVLRVANVVGYEALPGRRTFMAAVLGGLAEEARVTFDISPFVRRDFLPVEAFARAVAGVVRRRLAGTFNLGSGRAIETGRPALWAIEGFGRGELRVTDPRHHDEYVLDVGRLEAHLGPLWPDPDPAGYFRDLGRRLRAEHERPFRPLP